MPWCCWDDAIDDDAMEWSMNILWHNHIEIDWNHHDWIITIESTISSLWYLDGHCDSILMIHWMIIIIRWIIITSIIYIPEVFQAYSPLCLFV
jgi:hypothetical protein